MNTCLALKLVAFSGCEHFGTEKGSCGIYAVTFKALISVAVFFPWHSHIPCSVTDFLSGPGQGVWSRIFIQWGTCLCSSYSGHWKTLECGVFHL